MNRSGTQRQYNPDTGAYVGGSVGADSIMYMGDEDVEGFCAIAVESGEEVVVGGGAEYTLRNYTYKARKSRLRSTECEVTVRDPMGGERDSGGRSGWREGSRPSLARTTRRTIGQRCNLGNTLK